MAAGIGTERVSGAVCLGGKRGELGGGCWLLVLCFPRLCFSCQREGKANLVWAFFSCRKSSISLGGKADAATFCCVHRQIDDFVKRKANFGLTIRNSPWAYAIYYVFPRNKEVAGFTAIR